MNKLTLLLLFIFLTLSSLRSQIVINEIMYNPPEFGNDHLEYIELYNSSPIEISIKDYFIDDAVQIVFPDTTIKGFGYFVICVNSQSFDSVFGFKPLEWTNGALRNDSEVITLLRPDSTVMDSIRYFDTNGWPKLPDGSGPSLEVCRQGIDRKNPTYWRPSPKGTGIIIEGFEVKGTPGAANAAPCGDIIIEASNFKFTPADITINAGDQIEWINKGGLHNINGSQTTFPQNPEGFGNGSPSSSLWSYIHRFDIPGTYKYQSDPNAGTMMGNILVKLSNNEYPFYPIPIIKTLKPNGILDSLGVKCQVDGIVYGINFRPAGLQFTIINDQGDGIGVFNGSTNFGYSVKEGDRLSVRGVVSQFNGLAQITADTLILISSGNSMIKPLDINSLNENTESKLVRVRDVSLVNPIQWSNNPLGFTVRVSNGTNTFDIRIDNDCDLVSKEAPSGKFDITGIGSQNDPSDPYTENYQLWPRYTSDISPYVPLSKFYNRYDISRVRSINTEGVLDSLGAKCELVGTVYGIDLNGGSGLQFTLIDKTGGIAVFHSSQNYGYQVKEGDEVVVQGRIDQFRGLAEIIPDTLWKISSGNSLKSPRIITNLDESTESDLVRLNNLTIVNPGEWVGNGLSFGVRVSDGFREFILRIDDDTDLSKTLPSSNRLSVTGIGSQFDNSLPYDSDYQIMPRYARDIDFLSSQEDLEIRDQIMIYPNPVEDIIYFSESNPTAIRFEIWNIAGHQIHSAPVTYTTLPPIPSGFYWCKIYLENGSMETRKFIKK
jgi:plastocyanin/DNA/RNA endonuclease YhcR with UshA esterase domain